MKARRYTVGFRVLASVLLAFAVADHEADYFSALRVIVFLAATIAVVDDARDRRRGWAAAMVIIAIVFNPIAPLYLEKRYWIPFDLAASLIFILSVFRPEQLAPETGERAPNSSPQSNRPASP